MTGYLSDSLSIIPTSWSTPLVMLN